MKQRLLIYTLLMMTSCLHSQNGIHHKSSLLYKNYNKDTRTIPLSVESKNILRNFFENPVLDSINKNPFLNNLFEEQGGQSVGSAFNFNPASVAGLDVTTYANAIADVMIKRAKEELTVAFFDRFKKFSKNKPEFQVLFPRTSSNLENMLTYAYPQLLPALRSSFHNDLEQLSYHIDDVFELPKYSELLGHFPEIRVTIRTIRLMHQLENGSANIAEIIRELSSLNDWNDATASRDFKNAASAVHLAALFSESLRSPDLRSDSSIWISPKEVSRLLSDSIFTRLYMGLLYEQSKKEGIKFYHINGTVSAFSDMLARNKNNVFLFQNKTLEFVDLGHQLDLTLKEVKMKRASGKLSNEDVWNYIGASLDVMDYACGIANVFGEDLVLNNYQQVIRKSSGLYRDIYKREYSQAVNDAMDILTLVNELISFKSLIEDRGWSVLTKQDSKRNSVSPPAKSKYGQLEKEIKKMATTGGTPPLLNDPDLSKLLLAYRQKKHLDELRSFIEEARPYALFIADMSLAKTEQEVAAAFENAILPVGSTSIKKNAVFNISIQSYLGVRNSTAIGNVKNQINNSWNDRYGVTAPIGIGFSTGFKKAGAASLFLPLFDLGAVVDYKLQNDSTLGVNGQRAQAIEKKYEVRLGQIVSPGAYLVYSFWGNLPLAMGFGAQYGPGLTSIKSSGSLIVNPYWTFRAFVAVDLPLFTVKNVRKTSE